MPRDGFPFPVFIAGQPDGLCLGGEVFEFLDQGLLVFIDHVFGGKIFIDIDPELFGRKVCNMAEAGGYLKILTKEFLNGLGLGG